MRKAPEARPCGAGVPMDGLPPRWKQNDEATGAEVIAATGLTDPETGLADSIADESAGNDRRLFPRHS